MDQSKFAGRTSRRQEPAELKWLARFLHLHFRLVLSAAFGTAVTLMLLALPWGTATRLLVGWDSGVVLYLALIKLTVRFRASAFSIDTREESSLSLS